MAKKKKAKRIQVKLDPRKQTYFAFKEDEDSGTILLFFDGSMLELHTRTTATEWKIIVEETVRYSVYLHCLKTIGMPALQEEWSQRDDYVKKQLDRAVSRMRNIDPILVAAQRSDDLRKTYAEKMASGAADAVKWMAEMRETTRKFSTEHQQDLSPPGGGPVSEL